MQGRLQNKSMNHHYLTRRMTGRLEKPPQYNSKSNLKLPKNAATAIVKVLLPRIVPDGNMKDYNSMKNEEMQ